MKKLLLTAALAALSLLVTACPAPIQLATEPATAVPTTAPTATPTAVVEPTAEPPATPAATEAGAAAEEEQQGPPDLLLADPDRPGFTLDGSATLGDPDAGIVILEFSDFQCPYCRRHALETEPKLIENYVDTSQVRLIYKHFPLPSHERADEAAEAAECAAQQDQFWAMAPLLFERNDEWGSAADLPAAFEGYAQELGLDTAAFRQCLDSGAGRDRWQLDAALGQSAQVSGTPTFFVIRLADNVGTAVPGFIEFDQFKALLDQMLSEQPGS